jgi:hypothetical protein
MDPYKFIGFGAIDITKPYKFTGFGAIDITKPYKFIGCGAIDITKPCKFIGFGAIDITKPYKFIGFGAISQKVPSPPGPWHGIEGSGSGGASHECYGNRVAPRFGNGGGGIWRSARDRRKWTRSRNQFIC